MKKILFICLLCLVCNATDSKYNNYFIKYGKIYKIPPELLWGIAKTESNFKPNAININPNGSYDIGIMQINSSHKNWLKSQKISLDDLYDPGINIAVGSKILSMCIRKFGFTYKSLNCYNSGLSNTESNNYHLKVLNNIRNKRQKNQLRRYILLK
ncbi:hypothetical protein AWR31_08080 [Campylobacter fetus subsp. venerealis]|uniref:lytic transglycosylase domain-containing protein n=1 Tax=Campylobacter fetus TaxID=196 RepID=UPI0008188B73|nr:lytic transglycosylase domain-containing protein [Campylobacter fetus]OCS32888.1 hypothetical protein AWR31_08080 [Campylobacter fetus subsp. venerealis]